MSGEYDPQFQWLQIKTSTAKLIVEATIKQEGNYKLTSQTFMGHVDLCMANSQATIFWISVGNCVRNPEIESIGV
jgi:hypothetical protein